MPYFEHAGCQLYYEDHGQGEPLLLVHGLGSSIQDWEYQLPHLQQHRFKNPEYEVYFRKSYPSKSKTLKDMLA